MHVNCKKNFYLRNYVNSKKNVIVIKCTRNNGNILLNVCGLNLVRNHCVQNVVFCFTRFS